MEEPQETIQKSFYIYPTHIDFLEKINENTSLALRTVLDSIMRTEKHSKIKKSIDESMLWICFGLVLFILSFLLNGLITVIPLFTGIIVIMYGLIGGVTTALSRTRTRTR